MILLKLTDTLPKTILFAGVNIVKDKKKWCININLASNHWFIDCSNFEFKGSLSNKISFPSYYRGVIDLYLEIFQNIFNEENTLE